MQVLLRLLRPGKIVTVAEKDEAQTRTIGTWNLFGATLKRNMSQG